MSDMLHAAAGTKTLVKKETTAALVRKHQARQQASLARVYQRELAVEKAVTEQQQENVQQGAALSELQDEVAALTKLYRPIRGRAGTPLLPAGPCLLLEFLFHLMRVGLTNL